MESLFILLIAMGLSGALGYGIAGSYKVERSHGFFLGLVLGPIGWILTAFLPKTAKPNRPIRVPDLKQCQQCKQFNDVTDLPQGNYECCFCKGIFRIGFVPSDQTP